MSVILDALKKAEAERQRDGVLEIRGAQSTTRLANARRRRLWFISLLGTLVCTGAAWFTFVGAPSTSESNTLAGEQTLESVKSGESAANSAVVDAAIAQNEVALNGQTAIAAASDGTFKQVQASAEGASTMGSEAFMPAPAPELMQMSTGAAQRIDDNSSAQSTLAAIPQLAQPDTGAAQPVYADSPANPAPAVELANAAHMSAPAGQIAQHMAASEQAPQTVNIAPSSQVISAPPPEQVLQAAIQTTAAANNVPELYQLDYPTRHALPKLGLTLHVFDANPARSFVIVNNKRFGEGEQIEGSVLVAKIRREGVECEFNGQRFMLPRQL
jgi:general secretion pathway protein B